MSYIVRRLEIEGPSVVASASAIVPHDDLRHAQNEAERLARGHAQFTYDQDRMCWQGRDTDGRTFRYLAEYA